MHHEKAWYQSKKCLAFAFTGLLLLVSIVLKADADVTGKLAQGIMLGLPVLLGGQSMIDMRVRSATINAQSASTTTIQQSSSS